jgi:hypothetical protein
VHDVRHPRYLAVLVAEDLDRLVAVTDGALVERTLDAGVGLGPGDGHLEKETYPAGSHRAS